MPHRQREARESERIRMAASAARAATGSALDAALAQIGAAFDESAAIFDLKLRVERTLCRGPQHPAVRARFGARAERLAGLSLDGAVATIERWWRDERKAFQIASALGYGNRLSLDVLRELRLILQLMRRKRMAAEFGAIAAAVCDETMALAAE
ncbi:MAG: hypothetical protein WA776_12720 [Xanthobacteraceae bacterium]